MKASPSVEAQMNHARTGSLVVPASDLGVLVVTGGDRQTWLNGLLTCDLAPLKRGGAAYGLAVTQKGRILADALVLVDDERVLVAVPRSAIEEVRASFERYLIMEDAEIAPGDADFVVWLAHGPRSGEVLEAARVAGGLGGALDRSGLGGALIFAPVSDAPRIADAIAGAAGAIGDEAGWEALRVARAIPRFGVDFDGTTYPQEVGLEKTAVSFAKGCYLGQEVVCMLEMRGHVKRRLVALHVAGAQPPGAGAGVADAAGQAVGNVTSAAPSPARGGFIALAMVKRAQAEAGTTLRIGEDAATVIAPEA
jgi:folate-binding protein YgfZ